MGTTSVFGTWESWVPSSKPHSTLPEPHISRLEKRAVTALADTWWEWEGLRDDVDLRREDVRDPGGAAELHFNHKLPERLSTQQR